VVSSSCPSRMSASCDTMLFRTTKLPGVFVIELEKRPDERGFFARTWCRDELAKHGLRTELVQCSISYNEQAGTLRGMHYQVAPRAETKIVSCVRGAIYDVVLDLRADSSTYGQWLSVDLDEQAMRMVYIPEGCAHGFQTKTAGAVVHYQIADPHSPEHARGARWNDPAFGIEWPLETTMISQRDANFPNFPDDFRCDRR
jgi:dTDP-4-dehydrorhamnose 3,5-epimerase